MLSGSIRSNKCTSCWESAEKLGMMIADATGLLLPLKDEQLFTKPTHPFNEKEGIHFALKDTSYFKSSQLTLSLN